MLKTFLPPRRQDAKGGLRIFKNAFKTLFKPVSQIFDLMNQKPFLASWRLGGGIVFLALAFIPAFAGELDYGTLSLIPIQEGGRVKPLDTFARESVRFVTGREAYEGKNALATVLDWAAHPQAWD